LSAFGLWSSSGRCRSTVNLIGLSL
jgi:hypothetical protein